jgi:hypothetical protein
MKTLVHLRWFCEGMLLTALLSLACAFFALRQPGLQLRLLSEPNYLSLFSRAVAEKINDEQPQPVGVYQDEQLAGCDQRRVNFSSTAPLELASGEYQVNVDYRDSSEVRYSNAKQAICTFNGSEVTPRSVTKRGVLMSTELPILTPNLPMPNSVEFTVGSFQPNLVRIFKNFAVWQMPAIHLRALAFEESGPDVQLIHNKYPALGAVKLQKLFHKQVVGYYTERASELARTLSLYFLASIALSFCLLGLIYRKCVRLSRNDDAIALAIHLGGSAYRAVKLAGRTTFVRFFFTLDLAGYVEVLFLQQTEALAVTHEWVEAKRAVIQKQPAKQADTPTIASTVNGSGSARRLLKLLRYTPRAEEESVAVQEAKMAVEVAVKVVAANQVFKGFSLPQGLMPEGLPELQLLAITDILKTLLAGSKGLACFGQHRTNETSLRRSVFNHHPNLTRSPEAYKKALAWLLRERVVNALNESQILSYSITVGNDEITDLGRPLRNFLIGENQRRRGSRR